MSVVTNGVNECPNCKGIMEKEEDGKMHCPYCGRIYDEAELIRSSTDIVNMTPQQQELAKDMMDDGKRVMRMVGFIFAGVIGAIVLVWILIFVMSNQTTKQMSRIMDHISGGVSIQTLETEGVIEGSMEHGS